MCADGHGHTGVFWGLPDSVMTEISLKNVSVVTANPANAPWRCGDVKGMTAVDVSPPLVCDHSRGESEDVLLM